MNDQPSAGNLPYLWSLRPNEPAADYQLFTAWLPIPAPRKFRSCAESLGCSVHRLRRLSARHNWKTRAAAFDNHRASLASLALDQLLRDERSTWKDRAERFRLKEWLLYEEMLHAAHAAAAALRKRPRLASLRDIISLYELAFRLGRLATGLPLEPSATPEPAAPSGYLDAEAALKKIYGSDDSVQTDAPALHSSPAMNPHPENEGQNLAAKASCLPAPDPVEALTARCGWINQCNQSAGSGYTGFTLQSTTNLGSGRR